MIAESYLKPVLLPFDLPTSMYGAMLVIWQLRPGLQKKYPLHNKRKQDFVRFLAWCVYHGRREYVILRQIESWDIELNSPVALGNGSKLGGKFTAGMLLAGSARYKYSVSTIINSSYARNRVCRWYLRLGHDYVCMSSVVSVFSEGTGARTKIGYGLFLGIKGRALDKLQSLLSPITLKLRSVATEAQISSVTCLIDRGGEQYSAVARYPAFGVNLFGYARGELGIGEDVRMVARALDKVGVPFCVINILPGSDVSQLDASVEEWVVSEPTYGVNIFCMTGIEHARYVLEKGVDVLRGRYTIGLWPWELPKWPVSWSHSYGLVNEIWGISSYTALSYSDATVPVKLMPLAVDIGRVVERQRVDFGLPDDVYLYYFAFDYNSTLSRKNPEGLLDAFQKAFPSSGAKKVGLVLKVSHVRRYHKRWQRLYKKIKSDSRVYLIDSSLRRSELLSLYNCCDCLVSLHRSEGFGRTIVEAIMLGKQVIATNFSGNTDFCSSDRVGLVDFGIEFIDRGGYFSGDGQSWASPSVDDAVALMRRVYAAPIGVDGACVESYSLSNSGRLYKKRLLSIYSAKLSEEL